MQLAKCSSQICCSVENRFLPTSTVDVTIENLYKVDANAFTPYGSLDVPENPEAHGFKVA